MISSFLPPLHRRQSILDFGGKVLKALFGMGAISDFRQMHGVLDKL
jgi:hypothetical protein